MPAAMDAVSDVVPPLPIYPRWSPSPAPTTMDEAATPLTPPLLPVTPTAPRSRCTLASLCTHVGVVSAMAVTLNAGSALQHVQRHPKAERHSALEFAVVEAEVRVVRDSPQERAALLRR